MSEEPYCWECSQLKPGATPIEIMYAHEDHLSDGFGFYGGREAVGHVVGLMLRAERERVKRLEAVLNKVIPYAPTGVGMMARAALKEGKE